ncbi:MAG: hypothetical protein WC955_03405 [Elusimicrobiota bacterium]
MSENTVNPGNTEKMIAWYGFTMTVPQDWDIGAFSGNYDNGYLRIDDRFSVKLGIKWQTFKKKPNLRLVVDNFIKRIVKQFKFGKKAKPEFGAIRWIDDTQWTGVEQIGFKIVHLKKTHLKFEGVGFHCSGCNKTVVCQLYYTQEEQPLMLKVIRSLRDHVQGDKAPWAILDFHADIPKEFRLDNCEVKSAFLQMNFSAGKAKLRIARWGLADVLLRKMPFYDWSKGVMKSLYHELAEKAVQVDFRGHQAVELLNYKPVKKSFLSKGQPEESLNIKLWYCPEINRIFLTEIRVDGNDGIAGKFMEQVRVVCHEQ